LDYVKR